MGIPFPFTKHMNGKGCYGIEKYKGTIILSCPYFLVEAES